MRTTGLGKDGPAVSAVGLGCMSMSGVYGSVDRDEASATLRRAVELGITMFDTADFYPDNEELVGTALRPYRDQVLLATKTGIRHTPEGLVPIGDPTYLRRACDASLRRLGTDHIDIYYLARIDPGVPVEESVAVLGELVAVGKVRFVGLSEVSAATLRRAHEVHPIAAVETEYSLWERGVESAVLPVLRELGIGLVAYSPLGRGLLTGAIKSASDYAADDFRARTPRYSGDNLTRNLAIVDVLADIAAGHGATPAQVALAWVLSRGSDVVPIPGSSKRRHLEDNVAAGELRLTEIDLARIEAAVPEGGPAGDRYNVSSMRTIDR